MTHESAHGLHYLDNAATERVSPGALEAFVRAAGVCGNPSALHAAGAHAREELEGARRLVLAALGPAHGSLAFTSGGTEAINTALFGAARAGRKHGRHIVSTAVEHEATLETLRALTGEGFEVTLVPPHPDGTVGADTLAEALRPDTILVSLMAVNNETGALLPYESAFEAARRTAPHALTHLDAVQALGKRPLTLHTADLVSLSAHKIGGFKGCGALFVREGVRIRPLLHGGGQERGLRSGTEGVPLHAAFGAACAHRVSAMEANARHTAALRQRLLDGLRAAGGYTVHSPADASPYIVSLSPPKGKSEVLVRMLSDDGVYISAGSACARGRRSHVLTAMRVPAALADRAVRVSFAPDNVEEDVDALLRALARAVGRF